jgi:p-hydroxybenzoate 3-monooxygenase
VRDLIASFLDRGGEIHFETPVTGVHDVSTGAPWVAAESERWPARFVAGADGQHGVAQAAMPTVRRYRRDHQVSWLAILAEAPPSMAAVMYAIHPNGFAGHMARSPSVTRYYLQCAPGHDPASLSDDQIWAELSLRMRVDEYGTLKQGPIIERRVVDMHSNVLDPIQHGNLFLVGDAASLISPSAAKGANLAIMEADLLSQAMIAALRGDSRALDRYSADCLPRIWRAQEFSHWMINLLHTPSGDSDEATFLRALQRARLESLRTSRTHQDFFAENYIGI